jgi:membrane-bound lytic murein transglycosylase A
MTRRLRTLLGLGLALGLAAVLAGCATTPLPLPPVPPVPPAAPVAPATPVAWADLPGWTREDHLAALKAIAAACRLRPSAAMARACDEAVASPPQDDEAARLFIERRFRVARLAGEGLLTAYFTPRYEARHAPEPPFTAPVRPPPASGDAGLDRAGIVALPSTDALAWMRPEDLFFLQIQGSGVLTFPDGQASMAAFAGSNGAPFVAIAGTMRRQGLIDEGSGDGVHAWLAAHRGPDADAVMNQDPRYIFFRLEPDDGAGPTGAAGARLPPGRALAVDPTRHMLGELFWIDASAPALTGAFPTYQRLAVALDTGGAILGDIRADLYIGTGDDAGREAGRVRHRLTLYQVEAR